MESNGDTEKRTKPFYRNADDTIADVGISRRQLGYWQKQGLFSPELGPKTKFFTKKDTEQLRFLKRLIEDLGLPVATVKHLVAPENYWNDGEKIEFWGRTFVPPAHDHTFIDIEKKQLVGRADAMSELVADAIVGAKWWKVDRLLEPVMLLALRSAWMRSPNPEVYEAHVKALHGRLERIDLLSRLQSDADGQTRFWPKRTTDPDLDETLIETLTEEKKLLESRLNAARNRQHWE